MPPSPSSRQGAPTSSRSRSSSRTASATAPCGTLPATSSGSTRCADMAIDSLVLESDDVASTEAFLGALDLDVPITVTASDVPSSGFRGYTLSLVVPRTSTVDVFLDAALAAGGTALKPARKSFWGYGGVVQAPDGAVWKVATSSKKKDHGPASRKVDDVV